MTGTAAESCSVLDSAEIIDPTDLLESNMEVDEVNIGMHHPYLNNINSRSDNVILKCEVCDFVTFDPEELKIHHTRFHHPPASTGHTPGVGHLNKELQYSNATTNSLSPSVNNEQRENQRYDALHNVERRVLTLHGKSRSLWTCRQCGVASKSLGQVTAHVSDTHGIPGRFKCYLCSSLFTEENDLNRHLELLHYNHQIPHPGNIGLEDPVRCHVCDT